MALERTLGKSCAGDKPGMRNRSKRKLGTNIMNDPSEPAVWGIAALISTGFFVVVCGT
jgi:hypothetical protein